MIVKKSKKQRLNFSIFETIVKFRDLYVLVFCNYYGTLIVGVALDVN